MIVESGVFSLKPYLSLSSSAVTTSRLYFASLEEQLDVMDNSKTIVSKKFEMFLNETPAVQYPFRMTIEEAVGDINLQVPVIVRNLNAAIGKTKEDRDVITRDPGKPRRLY